MKPIAIPTNCWHLILKYLNLVERCNLRSTCKELMAIVDEFKLEDLFVCPSLKTDLNSNTWWSFSNDLIDFHNVLHNFENGKMPFLIRFPTSIKQNLRRLKVNVLFDCTIMDIRVFEEFKVLEQLEFNKLAGIYCNEDAIKLDSLRRFHVQGTVRPDPTNLRIVIDSPLLTHTYFGGRSFDFFVLTNPQSIRNLEVEDFRTKLDEYVNLEAFKCSSVCRLSTSTLFSILNLPNLIQIECSLGRYLDDSPLMPYETDRLKELFEFLIKQRKVIRKSNLKIYIRDVLIQDDKLFGDYLFDKDLFSVHVCNYRLLADKLPYFYTLDYAKFANYFQQSIPADFFPKYCNLRKLHVTKVDNQERLIQFIGNCYKLNHLVFDETNLGQVFFDKLPFVCSKLLNLEITNLNEIDFRFVTGLSYIHQVCTKQTLSTVFAGELFTKVDHLRYLCFSNDSNLVKMEKTNPYCLNIEWDSLY